MPKTVAHVKIAEASKKGLPLELVLDMDKMIELLLKHMALSFALRSLHL
jgi:hypothetical protein